MNEIIESMLGEYGWLAKEKAPKMLINAIDLYGIKEVIGNSNNPTILEWAKETGLEKIYRDDSEQPWCGLFVAVVAKRAGKPIPENPLWARNWAAWGNESKPELGAVLVFKRGTGGHVGLYVGEDKECYHVLGGNQSDSVCVARLAKDRLIACRAMYKIKPSNVRPVWLESTGTVSSNEA